MRSTSGTSTAVESATWDRGTGGATDTRLAALGRRRSRAGREGGPDEARPVHELPEQALHTSSASRCWSRDEACLRYVDDAARSYVAGEDTDRSREAAGR